jgi:hypothetical protein
LKKDTNFKEYMDEIVDFLKGQLFGYEDKVLKFFENKQEGEEIKVSDILDDVKLDKIALFFVLDSLKDKKRIYDFNAREVTLN